MFDFLACVMLLLLIVMVWKLAHITIYCHQRVFFMLTPFIVHLSAILEFIKYQLKRLYFFIKRLLSRNRLSLIHIKNEEALSLTNDMEAILITD